MTQSIPTTGAGGVRFRSRLEARWAAFFSLMRWPWQYEPDLGLDGWIPDFVITSGDGLLVEVKPVTRVIDFVDHMGRINASGTKAPCLLVGAALSFDRDEDPTVSVIRYETDRVDMGFGWYKARWSTVAWKVAVGMPPFGAVQRTWAKAGNVLQWRRM